MYKIDQDPDVLFGNVQIQPYKFEPLESGNDSVDKNLSGSDSSSDQDGITHHDPNNERNDHMDWRAFLNMLTTAVQRLVIN